MFTTPFTMDETEFLLRPRVQSLLAEAAKKSLVIVCAGAGYGKTRAVFEFARKTAEPVYWMQFSEHDNAASRFWAKYIRLAAGWDETFAAQCRTLGFPYTQDHINRYMALRKRHAPNRPYLLVLDDVHLVTNAGILRFLEHRMREIDKSTVLILVCRELPPLDLAVSRLRGQVPGIGEDELRFTESELALYLSQQGLSVPVQSRRDILGDTGGWAFSVNLIARSLKKSPGYAGYVRVAMKQNIFKLMETEVFSVVSPQLQRFLVRLSLIDHLSGELVATLAGGNETLLAELSHQSAYIRFDDGIHAYLIHRLFLDFLRTRQNILTPGEVAETYRVAAAWCCRNGFETDALGYWEKMGDYEAIVSHLAALPVQMPPDIAQCAAGIFERAPAQLSSTLHLYAVMHVRVIGRLGCWEDAFALMRRYEEQLLRMPEDDAFRNRMLGLIYYSWGDMLALMSTADGRSDFISYYAKMDACLTKAPVEPDKYADMPIGMWASLVGTPRKGALQEYIGLAGQRALHISHCWPGKGMGLDILCRAELLFYQGNARAATLVFNDLLQWASDNRQFEIESKALFYLMRLALWRGNREDAQQALGKMEARLGEESYDHRFFNHDAALGWYYCALRQPEMVPSWLKEKFAPYNHAYFIENLGNQIKARYHYLARSYTPLLAYIKAMQQRESILYGRVEMLVLKACAHYHMKDMPAAFGALQQACEEAHPNGILAPFVEQGKDMRTLISSALRGGGIGVPAEWLESVKRKAATFAKHQSLMVSASQHAGGQKGGNLLSLRERDVLADLYHGLSRSEIAAKQALSPNTVNNAVNSIFNKLGAHSVADAVRIAAEEKLV